MIGLYTKNYGLSKNYVNFLEVEQMLYYGNKLSINIKKQQNTLTFTAHILKENNRREYD